jgi:hypothetical protein
MLVLGKDLYVAVSEGLFSTRSKLREPLGDQRPAALQEA